MGGKVRVSKLKDRPIALNWNSLNEYYKQQIPPNHYQMRLAIRWGVSRKTIKDLGCGWIRSEGAWTFPVRNELCEIVGIQRIYPDNSKKMIRGSRIGIFVPTGIDWKDYIIICEGASDTATAIDIGFPNSIGRLSATCGNKIIKEFIKGIDVIIVTDNDIPGIKGAEKLATDLTKQNKCSIIYPSEGKDLRDFVKIKGKQYVKKWAEEKMFRL